MTKLWERAKSLFFTLNEMPENERDAFLEAQTEGEPELKALLLELIKGDKVEDENSAASQIVSESAQTFLDEQYRAKIGERFANYEIVDTIGEGGMGAVYLAERRDAQFSQKVAIKVIHSRNLMAETVDRFRQERQILASLQHPNIAQLISGGETENNLPFIVMEYIEGVNIVDYCRNHALSIERRLALFQQVLKAVNYAHQHLVIHRDIKASNVLVTNNGNVKLLDFGIAKLLDANNLLDDPHLTKLDVKVLTPINASPEQVLNGKATTRTDIYGLSTLLYQVLTEQAIFDTTKRSSAEIESFILQQIPSKPSDNLSKSHSLEAKVAASHIKGDLDTIVMKGLQKEPERRYSSVEHYSEDIERYLNCYPIQAKPDSNWYKFSKFLQRNKALSFAVGTSSVLLIAFISAILYQSKQIQLQRDIALRESDNARHISEFLKQTFESANPYIVGDKVVTPMDLINQAKSRIDLINTDPLLKGQLQLTLADVYNSLGELDEAETLATQAQQSFERVGSLPLLQSFDLQQTLSAVAYNQGNYQEASELIEPSIELVESLLSSNDDLAEKVRLQNQLIPLLQSRSNIQGELGNEEAALETNLRVLSISESLGENLQESLGSTYLLLGHSYRRLLDFEKSEYYLLKGAEQHIKDFGEDNLEVAYAYNQLASTYSSLEKFEEGIKYSKKGYEIRNRLFPNGHAEVASSLGTLANLQRAMTDYESAIENRLKIKSMFEKLYGVDHYYVGANGLALSILYMENGDYDSAQEYLDFSDKIIKNQMNEDNINYLRSDVQHGKILYYKEDYQSAINLLKTIAQRAQELAPDGHWITGEAFAYISLSQNKLGQTEQAKDNKTIAIQLYSTIFGERSVRATKLREILSHI